MVKILIGDIFNIGNIKNVLKKSYENKWQQLIFSRIKTSSTFPFWTLHNFIRLGGLLHGISQGEERSSYLILGFIKLVMLFSIATSFSQPWTQASGF